MPQYLRYFQPGGNFFFTVVAHERRRIFQCESSISLLGDAMRNVRDRLPFQMPAFVILPDHMHCVWRLPDGDTNYSTRWSIIKRLFTQNYLRQMGPAKSILRIGGHGPPYVASDNKRSVSRARHRDGDIWQRRFWEHTIRDEDDFQRHVDYIHFNPVKHGLVDCPHAWACSSFHRWIEVGKCVSDWQCICKGKRRSLVLDGIEKTVRE